VSGRGERYDRLGWALSFAAGIGLIVVGAIWVGNFIEDDTLISLRYAERFLDGKGLTWNDGERVEGYSNLAWVLASAGLGAAGVDLILAARVLAFSCWAVTLGALLMLARRVRATWQAFAAASIAFGATASVSVWGMGALEQPLVAACLALALWALAALCTSRERYLRWSALAAAALSLLVWTRPDAPLLVAVVAVSSFFLVRRHGDLRTALFASAVIAGAPFLAWLAQLGFRLAYYGEWFPNPAHIKTHLSWARMGGGLRYVGSGLGIGWLITAAGAVGAGLSVLRRETRGLGFAVIALLAVWTAYVVAIGGDHFPAFRHLLITQMCCAVLLVVGLSRYEADGRAPLVALVLVCLLVVPYIGSQRSFRDINVALHARWQWDGQAVGETFATAFAEERPLWAVTAAGCLPYFSCLPALDLLGLNDAHIARQQPDPSLSLAHDHGDGAYVLDRAPDLITFGLPRGGRPLFKSGREMEADLRFRRDYQKVTFRTLRPISVLSETYVRRRGRVGFAESAELLVPAYLLRGSVGHPMVDDRLGALLERGKKTFIDLPELDSGRYRVRLEPNNENVEVRLVSRAGPNLRSSHGGGGDFVVTAPTVLRLEMRAPRLSTLVGSIVIERLGAPPEDEAQPHKAVVLLTAATIGDPDRDAGRPLTDWTEARGALASAPFTVSEGAWLALHLAGGRARDYHTQVGVRVVDLSTDPPKPRMVFTGRDDETLREIRVDLTSLVGREVQVEIFDESPSAHIVAQDFVLH
jgi:hypothetical protein